MSKWTRRLGVLGIIGVAAGASLGCATERQPINRVQANALSKHFFVGADLSSPTDDPEFYMRNTVVDVPYGAAQDGLFTASYAQPLNRVKWEITESALVARQTYEHIQNSDHNGNKRTNSGQVVAMFAISSHFDIRRQYNPQTGEESNVVEENATDRPWYQREYMRVDWSKNMVTDGYEVDTLSQIGIFGGVKWDPMSYYVEDPQAPDAPVFAPDEGYFDVTTKAFATPQTIDTPYGTFPACFLPADYGGAAPIANCNPTEVTLRLSFRAVGVSDYEPVDWDGKKQDAFGWFTQERYGYERNYGVLDERWHRFASRYNIWDKNHVDGAQCAVDYWRDENGNVVKYKTDGNGAFLTDAKSGLPIPAAAGDSHGQPFAGTPVGADVHRDVAHDLSTNGNPVSVPVNGTEDECEFYDNQGNLQNPGSRCDEFTRRCTVPLYSRNIKTIPWYYGKDAPPDLFPSTANALGQWSLAIKRGAQIGKKVEAERVGLNGSAYMIDEAQLAADAALPSPTVADVFVLCHSPVIESDNTACGKPGLVARIGDIRYNSVNIINNPQTPSPWGIMVDADDPLTGEKVATSVNEWGHVLDIASQGTEDLLRWINGEITDKQIASGAYLRDWVGASKLGAAAHAPAVLSTKEINSRINSIDSSMAKLNGLTAADMRLPVTLRSAKAAANLQTAMGPSLDADFEATRQSFIGTDWEAKLVTPSMLVEAGMNPKTPIAGDPIALAKASPLRGANPGLNRWIRHMRDMTMASHASCMVEQPEPDSLVGMARQASRLYPVPDSKDPNYPALKSSRDQKLHQWIREQFHISVIAHEMGHSVGLRHNFTGSMDSLNYHTQYWQLRTRNGKEHYCVSGGSFNNKLDLDAKTPHTNGADCVGPRWVDPVTDSEVNGLIWKWGSSTVMDYPGDQTQDMNDIGLYDKAAMRFGYADIVDVDTDGKINLKAGPQADGQGRATDKGSAYITALDGFGGIGGQTLGGWHYSTYADKYGTVGQCTPQTDPNDPLSAQCSGVALDFVASRDMITYSKFGDAVTAVRPDLVANFGVDKTGRVRHPYMFGSDEFADIGNVPVFRFDAGADSYEQFQFLISTYENRYLFDNFRRDRTTFSTHVQVGRAADRYFDKIQSMTKSLALLVGLGFNTSDSGQALPLALGASDGFAMFARILTRPEPGGYAIQAAGAPGQPLDFAAAQDLNGQINNPAGDFSVAMGSGEGRYLHDDFDYSQGYYWADYQTQVGSAHEKNKVIYYLTEAYNHFISNSKEDYVDGRYKNLNYSSLYPNQMRRLFAQIMQNDPMTFGPFILPPTGQTAKDNVARVQYMPWEKYDPTDMSTINLDYSKGAVVLDPLLGWEEQFHSLFEGFYYGPTTLVMDWVDQMRIYSPGGTDTISIPVADQIRYRDPSSQIEYIARNYGTESINSALGQPVAKTSGARMLQYANNLAARTFQVSGADPVTGELTYVTDSTGQALCKIDAATCFTNTNTLKNYSANIDTVRQLSARFGYGPRGHGG